MKTRSAAGQVGLGAAVCWQVTWAERGGRQAHNAAAPAPARARDGPPGAADLELSAVRAPTAPEGNWER